ncbi:23S rRNA (guanine(745)-N(1))-methyltransferase [Vibrio aerogenes CECT 7868]|uniref:23S rRNA (Guanine(745)-N(1))-methyltransferase n=1 Tax=Vibrio aerogenes CECT 7868 TaxID=1216006 RepID=A0A1M6BTP7_9VIBR|nr:23S rRNA (guanine(745)-N(1))-methyltransferase [Vibrio aerogenes]SHI51924.1 23S rRNA (guanine(745)-N(1))-methyltransferase [Vibrio aerogenes CECT 7868]
MSYQCPICHAPLHQNQQRYSCVNNHQFDIAKEGYVNLMPVQHKHSKDPGDNKEMMQARRRFLEQGYYNPMREKVAQRYIESLSLNHGDEPKILDIGCGEGFYTNHIAERLTALHPQAGIYGLDISKTAVRYAAKRYKNCHFCVASSHRLPFADESLDGVLRIYAPCKPEELQRCIRPGGLLMTVTPAARHLYQLKELIYQEVHLHTDPDESGHGFVLESRENLHYTMDMRGEQAHDLLQMTPFAWRASESVKAELHSRTSFQCEADFTLTIYRKTQDIPEQA